MSQLGASVILLARNEEKLKSTLNELDSSQDQNHSYLIADFSNEDSINTICEEIKTLKIDILLNNTGGPAGGPIIDADYSAFVNTFNQHLIANHKLTQAVLPNMKNQPYGRIIDVISTSVKAPLNGLGVSNTILGELLQIGQKPWQMNSGNITSLLTMFFQAPLILVD